MSRPEAELSDEPQWAPGLSEEIRRYRGQWVAHTRDRVLAADPDHHKACEKARSLGVEMFATIFVPERDGPRFYSRLVAR